MTTDARAEYDAIAEEMAATTPTIRGTMFSMPCLKTGSKVYAGFYRGAMVFKLTGKDHQAALALTGAALFDPASGRPMREWVVVPAQHVAQWQPLAEAAFHYVSRIH